MNYVLDIDLDFFLADCCPLADIGQRPALAGHEPWQPEQVEAFLEQHCGLSKKEKIPGRVFETHDAALCFWQELLQQGNISAPFSVTHVDAHSDLGIGYPGPGFVLNTVAATRLEKRVDIEKYYAMNELDEANYLLFALGFRWIAELENVRNPRSHKDVPQELLLYDSAQIPCALQLRSLPAMLLEPVNGKEPMAVYREYRSGQEYYAKHKFDIASLAISPRYSPQEADALVAHIAEYFVLI